MWAVKTSAKKYSKSCSRRHYGQPWHYVIVKTTLAMHLWHARFSGDYERARLFIGHDLLQNTYVQIFIYNRTVLYPLTTALFHITVVDLSHCEDNQPT
jgi:hypothetical protein